MALFTATANANTTTYPAAGNAQVTIPWKPRNVRIFNHDNTNHLFVTTDRSVDEVRLQPGEAITIDGPAAGAFGVATGVFVRSAAGTPEFSINAWT